MAGADRYARIGRHAVTPDDRALLNRLQRLHSTLSRRSVLLAHIHSDVDAFAEGLRDMGQDLSDLGRQCLTRVAELDNLPIDAGKTPSDRIIALADALNDLTLDN